MKPWILLFFISINGILSAQNTWTGATNNRWNNAGNWTYGYIPIASEDVLINSNAKVIIPSGYEAVCNNLDINTLSSSSKDTLIIRANATLDAGSIDVFQEESAILNQGTINCDVAFWIEGTVVNDRKIVLPETWYIRLGNMDALLENNDTIIAGMIRTFGQVVNNGYIELGADGSMLGSVHDPAFEIYDLGFDMGKVTNYGTIVKESSTEIFMINEGQMINESSGIIEVRMPRTTSTTKYEVELDEGLFLNKGLFLLNTSNSAGSNGILLENLSTFENRASGSIEIGTFDEHPINATGGSNFINKGNLEISEALNGDMITGTAFFENDGGDLSGGGIISITNFDNSGVLSPGQSPGKITRSGNNNLSNVLYDCEIAGTLGAGNAGGYDQYEVTQNLNLGGGQLNISLLDGFVPAIGDQFTIVTTGTSMTNSFGTINYPSLPGNRTWTINYTSNEVVLEVVVNPLPIELSVFSIKENQGIHYLNWSTTSEINGSHFEIEYSVNGNDWQSIGLVQAVGNSSTENRYGFEYVPLLFNSIHYYRLKLMDVDGTYTYSEIQVVETDNTTILEVHPNPFRKQISLSDEIDQLTIYNQLGMIVFHIQEPVTSLDLSFLEAGIYLIETITNNQIKTNQIIKQ